MWSKVTGLRIEESAGAVETSITIRESLSKLVLININGLLSLLPVFFSQANGNSTGRNLQKNCLEDRFQNSLVPYCSFLISCLAIYLLKSKIARLSRIYLA